MVRGCLLAVLTLGALSAQTYDVLIRNARILDGAGNPWFAGDVAVQGDRIAAVGRLDPLGAAMVVDAMGLILAPGFIDTHSHGIRGIQETPSAENLIRQGVTTIIEGPDGSSPIPLRPFLDKLSDSRIGVNFGMLAGHGSIRQKVMGSENRRATADELERMKDLARQSMLDGAFGLSTGLFYVPGNYAPTEEVIELAKVAGSMGGLHTSHMRDEAAGVIDSVKETIRIGEEGHLPTQVTHHKVIGKANWGLSVETLRLVEAARARGVDATIDAYPYTASSTGTGALFPQWAMAGGSKALAERLAAPESRARIKTEIESRIINDRGAGDPKNVVMASCGFDRALAGKSLADITRERGKEVSVQNAAETAIEIQLRGGCSAIYHAISEEDVERILRYPFTMIASDGGIPVFGRDVPHPRNYGTFARVLGRYVRERRVLTLEDAVRKMTGLPAQRFGLQDRGLIRSGMKADLVLFDPATVADKSDFANPHQYAVGVHSVWVNGVRTLAGGAMTGDYGGRPLYGPSRRPSTAALLIGPNRLGLVARDSSESRLRQLLGDARVRPWDIHVGEGFTEPGTLVDGNDPSRALGVLWADKEQRRRPKAVYVCYDLPIDRRKYGDCLWRTEEGISVGSPLGRIASINRRPFLLSGFGWDYGGSVMSWEQGALGQWTTEGSLNLRFQPDDKRATLPEARQVMGDRNFSSAHPAMLKLNPRVYQIVVVFTDP